MSELNITEITLENFSETITKYISDKCIKITDIDSMIETYISMLGDHYLFKFDRDLLKDMLVDITYMYSPNDDANKDRVLSLLVGSDSDSEDEDEDGSDFMRKITNLTENLRNSEQSNSMVQTIDEEGVEGVEDVHEVAEGVEGVPEDDKVKDGSDQ